MLDWDNVFFNGCAFVAGLFILESGADRFVDHTAVVTKRLGVSPTLIALITAGAEWEELAVVIASVGQDRGSLALGNILGSTISNILGAFSLGLLFQPAGKQVTFDRSAKIYTTVLLFITSAFVALEAFNLRGRWYGIALILGFLGYFASIAYGIYRGIMSPPEDSDSDSDSDSDDSSDSDSDSEYDVESRPRSSVSSDREVAIPLSANTTASTTKLLHTKAEGKPAKPSFPKSRPNPRSLTYHIAQLVFGLGAISISGYVLSHSISTIADSFNLSGNMVGMTILSFATTLPEKLVAIVGSSRGHGDIVVANTAGSNIFLLTLCAGVLYVAAGETGITEKVTLFELLVTWASAIFFFIVVFFGFTARWIGGVMMTGYVAFIALEFTSYLV